MDKNSPLLDKSLDFSVEIVKFYELFNKTHKDNIISNQLLRAATSIGANANEASGAVSRADFVSKLHISLKETNETLYWLEILKRTNFFEYDYDLLINHATEIKRIIVSSLKTTKRNDTFQQ